MKKEKRRGMSKQDFEAEHRLHNPGSIANWTLEKDSDYDLWRLLCACGKTWVGDNLELGIELG